MTNERLMSYEPVVGDKVRFLMDTSDWDGLAKAGEIGTVSVITEVAFYIRLSDHRVITMKTHGAHRIPHDLMRIECTEPVPTPCYNQVDVDAVIKRCGDKPSCHDVTLKFLTVMEVCRELRRYRLEEKERAEASE